jgi:hypothetical protein
MMPVLERAMRSAYQLGAPSASVDGSRLHASREADGCTLSNRQSDRAPPQVTTPIGRGDLILPVYYVSTPEIDDPGRRDADPLAAVLAARQHADWRDLRFEPATSPVTRKATAHLATRMRDAFWRPLASMPAPDRTAPADPIGPPAPQALQAPHAVPARGTARTEPPTHVVDPFHRGDFTTISEAVRRGPGPLAGAERPGAAEVIRLTRSMTSGPVAQFAIVAGVRDHLTPG